MGLKKESCSGFGVADACARQIADKTRAPPKKSGLDLDSEQYAEKRPLRRVLRSIAEPVLTLVQYLKARRVTR